MSERRWLQGNGGVWIAGDTASDAFMERVRVWVDALPEPVMRRLRESFVCIWTLHRLVDYNREWAATYQPTGWDCSGVDALEQMEGWFTEGAWREGRRKRPAVFIAEEWKPANIGRWIPNTMPYTLYHEIGHAVGTYCGRPRPHGAPEFRRIYLAERHALTAGEYHPDLRYFTGPWGIGMTEVFAESFAALHTTLPGTVPGYDAAFRAAFPRALAHVRSLVSAEPAMEQMAA